MLAKLLDKGVFEVMIPCEINGKEDNDIQYGIVTYNPNKPKARVLNGACDYATS